MINYSLTSKIKCSKYFYIKKGKQLLQLDDFVKQIKKSNNGVITHDLLEKNIYLYRGKEYEYKELINQDVLGLKTATVYKQFLPNMGTITLKNSCLARLIETLDRYINKARYELIKSANIIDINYLNSDVYEYQYEWYYIQRCFSAENAIYSYYAAFEILLQIIWIYREFGDACNNVKDILESYSFRKLLQKLVKKRNDIFCNKIFLRTSNKNKDKLELQFKFKQVRNWCNNFKHKDLYRFDGEKVFDINFSYKYLDMDNKVIPELINYHNELLKLSNYIILNIEF